MWKDPSILRDPVLALTPRQRAFVQAYAGNAEEAARKAGYSESFAKAKAHKLLRNPLIQQAIRESAPDDEARGRIADREARKEWWTKIMYDETQPMRVRLKASELLARSEGDFFDRVEISTDISFAEVLKAARERLARR